MVGGPVIKRYRKVCGKLVNISHERPHEQP
jgi:hypothetical protein